MNVRSIRMESPLAVASRIFGAAGLLVVLLLVLLCATDCTARTGPPSRNSVGDGCRLSNGRRGQCRLITECPSAVAAVRNGARRGNVMTHQRCGFKGTIEIVCCEGSDGAGNGQGSRPNGGVRTHPGNPNLGHRRPWFPGAGGKPQRDSEWLSDGNQNVPGRGGNTGRPSQPQTERKATAACRVYTSKCPAKVSPYIVDGIVAALGEFPHMAALGYSATEMGQTVTKWDCGGTLISDRYVLTAAHCSHMQDRKPVLVRLGESDFTRDDDGASPIDIPIENIVTHPQYDSSFRYNDIALVRLQRSVQLNEFICPACLYTAGAPQRSSRLRSRLTTRIGDGEESQQDSYNGDDYEAESSDHSLTSRILPDGEEVGPRLNDIEDLRSRALIVTGWGRTEFGGEGSAALLKAPIQAVASDECNSTLLRSFGRAIPLIPRGVVASMQLCAGDTTPNGKKDSCQGDSGGPLQFQNKDSSTMHTVVGVTSFGLQCGQSLPGLYTRVSSYVDWIESVVWPQGPPS